MDTLRQELVTVAKQKPQYGYRRLRALLSASWHKVKAKGIYRLYRQEYLVVRRLKRKQPERGVAVICAPNRPKIRNGYSI